MQVLKPGSEVSLTGVAVMAYEIGPQAVVDNVHAKREQGGERSPSHLSVVWCCRILVFRWISPTPAVAPWHAATPRGRHACQRTSGGIAACHL